MLEKYIKSSNIMDKSMLLYFWCQTSRCRILMRMDSAVEVFIEAEAPRKDNMIIHFLGLSGFINHLIEDGW